MTALHQKQSSDHELTVDETLRILVDADLVSRGIAEQAKSSLTDEDERHPFVQLSETGLRRGANGNPLRGIDAVGRAFAGAVSLEYVRIDPLKIDVEAVTAIVSQAYAQRFNFLPIQVNDNEIVVATGEPFLRGWESEVERIAQAPIRRVLCNPEDIARYRYEFYGVSRSISGATSQSDQPGSFINNFEQLTELGEVGEADTNDRHVVHLVDWLLQYAFDQRASDIHIEPRRDQSNIRFRIDGVLHLIHQLPTAVVNGITSRLKSLGRMDVADKRRPQDGRIRTKTPGGNEVELRLSTMPTTFGEKLVLRVFDPEKLTQPFSALGFTKHDLQLWQAIVEQPHGIVLVTGPTGSGKTTTLYSALKMLARPEINVCTIEDPIEMVEPQFNQMQVQASVEIDFASGVRTLLRQDPDIIMIGEIRDRETADVAIQAALTGHLVLSTLHTNDAPSAVTRLVDIGVQPFLIGATLLGVVAQRLVRTLCQGCTKDGKPSDEAWRELIAPHTAQLPTQVKLPVGCDDCRHTGFRGREGIYEILTLTDDLSELITPDVNTQTLRSAALQDGMRPLALSGAQKIANGKTTIEEVLSVVPNQR
ncbi:MAG: GspE/PulE family protein [Pseudomonadota bacterium]